MEKSESITELVSAIAKAKLKFTPLLKTGKADFKTQTGRQIKYDYVELENILEMSEPILAAEGVVLVQEEIVNNGTVEITTWFFHSSGEYIQWDPLVLPIATGSGMGVIQSIGTTISYCRRYDLLCKLGLAGEKDTDGIDLIGAKPATPIEAIKKPKAKKNTEPPEESRPFEDDELPEVIKGKQKKDLPIDEDMKAKRKIIIDEIAEILTNPIFTDGDKEVMKRNIKESNTLPLLQDLKKYCMETEKTREIKAEKGE